MQHFKRRALIAEADKTEQITEIVYIYKENGGLHTTYNEAIAHITTELSFCIDSDIEQLKQNFYITSNSKHLIENYFVATGDWSFGSAISLVMVVIILITMYFTRKLDYDKENR